MQLSLAPNCDSSIVGKATEGHAAQGKNHATTSRFRLKDGYPTVRTGKGCHVSRDTAHLFFQVSLFVADCLSKKKSN